MKAYCQFYHLSTGYVDGSIPPRFEESNKNPIEILGSNGVFILDSRCNLVTMIDDCEKRLSHLSASYSNICGFKIFNSQRFDSKNCIYSSVK